MAVGIKDYIYCLLPSKLSHSEEICHFNDRTISNPSG